jgi:carbon monoxide dehydrogenase subunit G
VPVVVTVVVAAPVARVWRALTDPSEVERWDGVRAVAVPEGYPAPGQYARWSTSAGPLHLTLHDRVRVVEPTERFASTIDVGFVHVEEEYRLRPSGLGTLLVSDNAVSARPVGSAGVLGIGRLAAWLTGRNVGASMARLKAFCEQSL